MFRNYSFLFIILFSIELISQERDSNNYTFNGNKFAEKEVFDEAEMSYRKAISSKPDNSKALYNLGNTHYKEKDFDKMLSIQNKNRDYYKEFSNHTEKVTVNDQTFYWTVYYK